MNLHRKQGNVRTPAVLTLGFLSAALLPQTVLRADNTSAVISVEGTVEQVFSAPVQSRYDFLVYLNVQRSEVRRQPPAGVNVRFPAPGEPLYVQVSQLPGGQNLPTSDAGVINSKIPKPGNTIRAFLVPRESGVWTGASSEWFETTVAAPQTSTASPNDPQVRQKPAWEDPPVNLGMTTQPAQMDGKVVLKVTSVERSGPARSAGLEVGDVIIGVNRAPLSSPGQLEELALKQEELPIVVVDVNSGRTAQVALKIHREATGSPATTPEVTTPAAPPTPSLGVSAEQVRVGLRTALKVLGVEPGSPAAEAGIEPGDIIVAANGAAITGPEQLGAALRKAGAELTLTIRDVNTNKDVPVTVNMHGASSTGSLPDSLPKVPGASHSAGNMGLVTELAFYNVEAAVRITEVAPGSPAARAGLKPGLIILQANGKPVLHPNELTELERTGGQMVRLTIVDPATGRKGTAEVRM